MADQNITALPKKTSSQMAATDYLMGIDSAEGYQMLIQDLGDYIIQHATSSLAGANQTLAAAVNALNSKLGVFVTSGSLHDILTPGIYYIGSSVTDQPVQQNGYGGMYIVSSGNEITFVGAYISMYDKSIWSTAKLYDTWTYTQMAKHVALSPTLSGCGSGSSIHAVQIGTVVVVTAKIEYSGTNVTISGLPAHSRDIQNGFAIVVRDQNDGNVVRMWTNGSSSILKVDNLTENHLYGLSYTYIIA